MIKAIKFASVRSPIRIAPSLLHGKLGFILTDKPFDDKQRWIELSFRRGTGLVLFTPDAHRDRIRTFSAISFHCDDLDKTYAELTARGVSLPLRPLNSLGLLRHFQRPGRKSVRHVGPVSGGPGDSAGLCSQGAPHA